MDQHTELHVNPLYVLGFVVVLSYVTARVLPESPSKPVPQFWLGQVWTDSCKTWLGRFWTSIRSATQMRAMLQEGYLKYSKNDRLFVVPQFVGPPVVMLPPSRTRSLLQKSDDEVKIEPVVENFLAIEHFGYGDVILRNPTHVRVVRRQLTRKLPLLTGDIHEELVLAFNDEWNTNSQDWTVVPAYSSCMSIASRAANRVFSGSALCRNAKYLEHSRLYALSLFGGAAFINLLPNWLGWVVGPIVKYNNWRHIWICKSHAGPFIQHRMNESIKRKHRQPAQPPKDDAIEWLIDEAMESERPEELTTGRICLRLLLLNSAAIHTISITITNTLLDLYSSPQAHCFVEGLREEVDRVLKTNGGRFSKSVINDLVRTDSTIKESMRLRGVVLLGMNRMITQKDGVDFDGIHIPAAVRIGLPIDCIQRDPQNYPHPDTFDAFRFSRARENADNYVQQRSQNMVTTSDSFMSFGHGRHSCPGRFFASQELKLLLAHIVMTYDVRVAGGVRPKNQDIGMSCMPTKDARLEVRLRS